MILHPAAERELRHLREAPERTARSASRIFIVVGDDQSLAIQATGEDGKRAATDALGTVRQRVRGIDYHFGARSFFQSNRLLIDSFVAKVVGDAAGQSAVDLYAGVGLFSLQLAGHFARVCAVEGDPVAVRHGIQNREINGIANVEYHSLSVEAWLKHHGHEWRQSDLLLLDPPRAGAGVRVCQSIVALAPRQVRYVSCNPTTLARDLRTLVDGGYSISAITLIDMFPQTFHVEAVVTLLPDRNEKIG
ncbi:MAG: class I SAM-dependent RNA methyltransferase [Acidobacteria bacterium]|nr:class I SAM-dependent RNA methyltransferase [Acidobacteriota bacterium]